VRLDLAIVRTEPVAERFRCFESVTAVDPLNFHAHNQMLGALHPAPGGAELMFSFARERAANAPDGSDLPALVVEAHLYEWKFLKKPDGYFRQPGIGDELVALAYRSVLHPASRFRPGLTPTRWNAFAFALTAAERFEEAQRCFELIGESNAIAHPWPSVSDAPAADTFVEFRNRARRR
jgi:hypothetical protein